MGDRKSMDFWDSTAKFGGVIAGSIFGSVFAPVALSKLITGWLDEQIATNPLALAFSCVLAALMGAGIACSIAIPVLKRRNAKSVKRIEVLETERDAATERAVELDKKRARLKALLDARRDNIVDKFREEDPFIKMMAMDAYDNGGISDPFDFIFSELIRSELLGYTNAYFVEESLIPSGTKWILRDDLRAAIDEDPSLLAPSRAARERGDEGDYSNIAVKNGVACACARAKS